MSLLSTLSLDDIKARGAITEIDVQRLRRAYYNDGAISKDEAEAVFALHRACPQQDNAWLGCFVEMLTDHIVNQTVPEGYLTAENAQWLLGQISSNGRVVTKAEVELLVNILDKSRWSPQSLVTFALGQVRDAVLSGDGPIRDGSEAAKGSVSEYDVELLRRILYAFGGDGNVAITRSEAEVLFEINDATAGADNAEGWRDLFVKAIANCVLAASMYTAPSREQALAREAWLDRRGDLSIGTMAEGMARDFGNLLSVYREQSREEQLIARLERQKIEIVTGEEITVAEATWLAARIGRDGVLTPNEKALVEYLRSESWKVAPELADLLSRFDVAA
jgi:hypothetical protein